MAGARLPKPTRRFVDRLARRAHAFHRFAHHPLCDRYANELLPLGRKLRVCRGCSYAALGVLSGALGAAWWRPAPVALALSAALAACLLLASLVLRLPKSLGRGLACFTASGAGLGALLSNSGAVRACAAAWLTLSLVFLWGYRKRGPNRGPCSSCPERLAPRVCTGLRPIVLRERAFRRLAQRFIDQADASRG